MSSILPIRVEDLIHARTVESERIEFKKSWNENIRRAVTKTLCAFANDLHNLNGGYIVLGIEEQEGKPVLPPAGLEGLDLDRLQKEIRGSCKRIDPEYHPVISPEVFMGKSIVVLWAPAGDSRPYQAPAPRDDTTRKHFVRMGSESVEALGEVLNQLLQLTAKTPYDDRRRTDVPIHDVSGSLIRKFLSDVGSDLAKSGPETSPAELLRFLRCTSKMNGEEVPRNVALMFFTDNPDHYFPGTRIEVVHYGDEAGGDLIEEQVFRGPLASMLKQALDYLDGLSTELIHKVPSQAEVQRFVAFPYEAMEEALANAVLHRGYDAPREPIKVGLYPDRMEIVSYPGPVPGLEIVHLQPGSRPPALPQRNRRIGEFLKDLRLAEMRNTGIPKIFRRMQENGSPQPIFEFDKERTYFRVILPAHPQYVVIHALREGAQLWATGERQKAISRLEETLKGYPGSGSIVSQLIDYHVALGDFVKAKALFEQLDSQPAAENRHLAYIALARAYLDQQDVQEALRLLKKVPRPGTASDALEMGILLKRSGRFRDAHKLFTEHYRKLQNDPKAVHEFAQTKIRLARQIRPRSSQERQAKKRLNEETRDLLRRVIQLADHPMRAAWAWSDLAGCLSYLKAPRSEVAEAYDRAIELAPDESRFKEWKQKWEQRSQNSRGRSGVRNHRRQQGDPKS